MSAIGAVNLLVYVLIAIVVIIILVWVLKQFLFIGPFGIEHLQHVSAMNQFSNMSRSFK